MRPLLALIASCLLVLTGSPVQAHTGSYDMKYIDGSNLILLTFNTHQPVSGLDIVHNIRLYDLVGAPIPYDEVHVEVRARGNTERLAVAGSSLISEETMPMLPTNESKLTYAYPLSGSYTLTAEFRADGRAISRAEFAVEVGRGSTEESSGFGLLPLAGAFLLGIAVMLPFRRRRPALPSGEEPVGSGVVAPSRRSRYAAGATTDPGAGSAGFAVGSGRETGSGSDRSTPSARGPS